MSLSASKAESEVATSTSCIRRKIVCGSACSSAASSSTIRICGLFIMKNLLLSLGVEWQLDQEGRTFTGVIFNHDSSLVFFNDTISNGEAKSCSRSDFLGGEEGIEDTLFKFGWYTWSGIAETNSSDICIYCASNGDDFA